MANPKSGSDPIPVTRPLFFLRRIAAHSLNDSYETIPAPPERRRVSPSISASLATLGKPRPLGPSGTCCKP